jgi:hypothetical protein
MAQRMEVSLHSGMMWHDDASGLALEARIRNAVKYYHKKYGRRPTLCLIPPGSMVKMPCRIDSVTVHAYGPVLAGHFWIGVEIQPGAGSLRANGHRKGQRVLHRV